MKVHYSSKKSEHYTPSHILDAVVQCLGVIDLDPCSNSSSFPHVPARHHFTKADDALVQEWHGKVFMNPPYGREIKRWVAKLLGEYQVKHVTEAIALVPSRTDTKWLRLLRNYPIIFIYGRLTFVGSTNPAPFPSALVYLGDSPKRFYDAFVDVGDMYQRVDLGWEKEIEEDTAVVVGSSDGSSGKHVGSGGGWVELKMINGYGPYAYKRWRSGGKTRSEYIGKVKV